MTVAHGHRRASVMSEKKVVGVSKYYAIDGQRSIDDFHGVPLFTMTRA